MKRKMNPIDIYLYVGQVQNFFLYSYTCCKRRLNSTKDQALVGEIQGPSVFSRDDFIRSHKRRYQNTKGVKLLEKI